MNYDSLIKDLTKNPTQKSIGTDKGLAKIGDGVVNLIYSVAKSIILTNNSKLNNSIRTGKKVSKRILGDALKRAEMKDFAKTRADAHDLADTVEAIVAYIWFKNIMSIKEMIDFLVKHLAGDLYDINEEIEQATIALTDLLNHIKQYLPKE
ncbi:MAG: hypothetical protein EU548_05965 [Promethearchaeota archaeon]|nr:MAG: hypothetical protein EU548_05965 [Candidatus Lokiarchaeota archaeon]